MINMEHNVGELCDVNWHGMMVRVRVIRLIPEYNAYEVRTINPPYQQFKFVDCGEPIFR